MNAVKRTTIVFLLAAILLVGGGAAAYALTRPTKEKPTTAALEQSITEQLGGALDAREAGDGVTYDSGPAGCVRTSQTKALCHAEVSDSTGSGYTSEITVVIDRSTGLFTWKQTDALNEH